MFRLVRIPIDSSLAPTYFYCVIVKLFLNLLMLVLASNVLSILFKKNVLFFSFLGSWLMIYFFQCFRYFVILTDFFQKYFPPLWTICKRLGFLKGARHINFFTVAILLFMSFLRAIHLWWWHKCSSFLKKEHYLHIIYTDIKSFYFATVRNFFSDNILINQ